MGPNHLSATGTISACGKKDPTSWSPRTAAVTCLRCPLTYEYRERQKIEDAKKPKGLRMDWMCAKCKTEHAVMIDEVQLIQESDHIYWDAADYEGAIVAKTPRLKLGTVDLRCPNDSIKETPMCGCDCHNYGVGCCAKCSCWSVAKPRDPMFPFKTGQKVRITYPTGTVVVATLTNRGSTCLGYKLNEAEHIERVIQPDGSMTRSCDIEILEEPKMAQPEYFGAAVKAGSHLREDREYWVRTHERHACDGKDPYGCYHWRNAAGQMTTWHNLCTPELVRASL